MSTTVIGGGAPTQTLRIKYPRYSRGNKWTYLRKKKAYYRRKKAYKIKMYPRKLLRSIYKYGAQDHLVMKADRLVGAKQQRVTRLYEAFSRAISTTKGQAGGSSMYFSSQGASFQPSLLANTGVSVTSAGVAVGGGGLSAGPMQMDELRAV